MKVQLLLAAVLEVNKAQNSYFVKIICLFKL